MKQPSEVAALASAPVASNADQLRREAERIRSSGVLGETRLMRLFDYLVDNSLAGRAPKEITIALDVFGKDASFDVTQNSFVRVYIHKLRRVLEQFYQSGSPADQATLYIPRGEYRLALAEQLPVPDPKVAANRRGYNPGALILLASLSALAAGAAILAYLMLQRSIPLPQDIAQVAANPIWQRLLGSERPLMIVVGDYYLVGETDDGSQIDRLIREYSVNSKTDLDSFLKLHPAAASRYMDVGLHYLPTSVAFAIADVMPVLAAGRRRVQVSTMAQLSPDALRTTDIVYIGYLSGLGTLRQLVFTGSRFAIGASYDELTDTKNQRVYISQTASQADVAVGSSAGRSVYHDYGFFSSFIGPGGNSILILSGTRDEGVRQTADALTNAAKLRELSQRTGGKASLEGLFEVRALDGVNLTGQLLAESKR